jgi:hypothetical protein
VQDGDPRPGAGELGAGTRPRTGRKLEPQLLMRAVRGRLGAGDPVAATGADVPIRGGVVLAQPGNELDLVRLPRAGVLDDPVPLPRNAVQRRRGEGAPHEGAKVPELGRRRGVQQQADSQRRISRVVPEAVAERLDRVADLVRVPEVDEERGNAVKLLG